MVEKRLMKDANKVELTNGDITELHTHPPIPASKVRAYQSTSQSIIANIWTRVNLQTVMFDVLGEFSNNRFTAKQAGYYEINASSAANKSGAFSFYVTIYKNGVLYSSNYIYITYPQVQVGDLLKLNIGDYVELFCWSYVPTNLYALSNSTFMSITRVL